MAGLAWEDYLIQSKIGTGAFSTVYKAQHKVTKNLVAIKAIRVRLAQCGACLGSAFLHFGRKVLNQPKSATQVLEEGAIFADVLRRRRVEGETGD